MKQPCAKVSKKDIEKIIIRDYAGVAITKILKKLCEYKSEYEKFRVWAALLKISEGSIVKLNKNILIANSDYRDILAVAEYPMYTKVIGFNDKNFSKNEVEKIIKSDWEQYKNWLNGHNSEKKRRKKSRDQTSKFQT